MRALCLAAACVTGAGVLMAQESSKPLVLEGATLISPERAEPLKNAVVVIRGNRIEAVGGAGSVTRPAGAEVLDLRGKYLLPGFIDTHVHYRNWLHDLFLVNGTTTVLDLGNGLDWTVAVKEGIAKGKIRGPRMFVTGDRLDGPQEDAYQAKYGFLDRWVSGAMAFELEPIKTVDTHTINEHRYYVRTPEEARAIVRKMVAGGADAIKVHHKLEPELLKAITDESHKLGRAVTGHALNADEMVDQGMDFIEHMSPIAIATITDKAKLQEVKEGRIASPFSLMDPADFPRLIRKLVDKKVYLNPTLSGTGRGVNQRRDEYAKQYVEYFSQPGLRYVPAAYVQNFIDEFAFWERISPEQRRVFQAGYDKIELFVKMFSNAGGKLLAGSDPVSTGIAGLGIHQEMQLMVDAGVSPMEALKSATTYAAELIRKEKELGTVEVGKLADLVALDGDPLQEISNTRKVNTVVLDGKVVDLSFHPDYKIPIPRAEPFERVYPAVSPHIDMLSPAAVPQGTNGVELTLRGRFLPTTKFLFNGKEVPGRFEDVSTVKIAVPANLLTQVGTFLVQGVNAIYGGETAKSNSVFFIVKY